MNINNNDDTLAMIDTNHMLNHLNLTEQFDWWIELAYKKCGTSATECTKEVRKLKSIEYSFKEFKPTQVEDKIIQSILQSINTYIPEPNYSKQQYSKSQYLKHNKNI